MTHIQKNILSKQVTNLTFLCINCTYLFTLLVFSHFSHGSSFFNETQAALFAAPCESFGKRRKEKEKMREEKNFNVGKEVCT
jgi:hypothetical protein